MQLADALIAADRSDEALSRRSPLRDGRPEVLLRTGKALYVASRAGEAMEVLDNAMTLTDAMTHSNLFGDITQGGPVFNELGCAPDWNAPGPVSASSRWTCPRPTCRSSRRWRTSGSRIPTAPTRPPQPSTSSTSSR